MENVILKNGAAQIDRKGDIVIAKTERDFVTWGIDPEGNCYWGHYFGDDFKAAAEDFTIRCDK